MVEPAATGLKIALIGATGAVGKEIVRLCKNDSRISEIALVVRRTLDEWKEEEFTPKLRFIVKEDFSNMDAIKEELAGYHAFLCSLGSRVGRGETEFV